MQVTVSNQRTIFLFWMPLVAMWIMMAIEPPAVAAVIARLPFPKENLAAFGVVFSLVLLIESPIIQLLTAGTALAKGLAQYRKLMQFMNSMALVLTSIHLLIALTPAFDFIMRTVLGVPDAIIAPSRIAFLLMAPWSAAVGYRRLWQGILIGYGRTGAILPATLARIGVSGIVLAWGLFTGTLPGASTGALALSLGVIASAAVSYGYVVPIRKNLMVMEQDGSVPTWRGFFSFYIPLALTSFIGIAARPVLTAGLAQAPDPLESLAVWPVVSGFLFIFNAIAISLQEVVISLSRDEAMFRHLRLFTAKVAAGLGLAVFIAAVSPAGSLWYRFVAALPPDLMRFTRAPMLVLILVPPLFAMVSLFRGVQVHRRKTILITWGVAINFSILSLVMLLGVRFLPFSGVVTVSIALVASLAAEALFLKLSTQRNLDFPRTDG